MTPVPLGLWIVGTAAELAPFGVGSGDIRRLRVAHVGQSRALSRKWARAIGCWGRVETLIDIAERVAEDPEVVRNHAKVFGLKFATRREQRSQPELALALYCDRAAPRGDSCRRFGVLAAERVVYCTRVQEILDAQALDIRCILLWTASQWNATWDDARPVVDIEGLCRAMPGTGQQTTLEDRINAGEMTDADGEAFLAILAQRRAAREAQRRAAPVPEVPRRDPTC